jgi:hypothetical protein
MAPAPARTAKPMIARRQRMRVKWLDREVSARRL